LRVSVGSGAPGSRVSGRGQCRVAAFRVSGLHESDFLFITISHCAWRHVISLSKATKKRSKENAFNHATRSVHSVQFLFMGAPKARCSPEPRMCEPLLLANPDIDTLRHQCSRASTICPRTSMASREFAARFLGGLATWFGMRPYLVGGFTRIARGEPCAGSVTGGEARQNPRSEKEGFTHPPLWRAPCFWGTYE
jgi:hypothetical protein